MFVIYNGKRITASV